MHNLKRLDDNCHSAEDWASIVCKALDRTAATLLKSQSLAHINRWGGFEKYFQFLLLAELSRTDRGVHWVPEYKRIDIAGVRKSEKLADESLVVAIELKHNFAGQRRELGRQSRHVAKGLLPRLLDDFQRLRLKQSQRRHTRAPCFGVQLITVLPAGDASSWFKRSAISRADDEGFVGTLIERLKSSSSDLRVLYEQTVQPPRGSIPSFLHIVAVTPVNAKNRNQ